MSENLENYATDYLNKKWHELSEKEKTVIESIQKRKHLSKNINVLYDDKRTFGERVADSVAKFGGSWTFIFIFGFIFVTWVIVNSLVLFNKGFDPYPYILLNLFLSMLAAIQAPIIMMSQNRQADRDRIDATHDYQVNLKALISSTMLPLTLLSGIYGMNFENMPFLHSGMGFYLTIFLMLVIFVALAIVFLA